MSKPRKVEEPQAAYAAPKPAKANAAAKEIGSGNADFERITKKLLTERKELLNKLAQ